MTSSMALKSKDNSLIHTLTHTRGRDRGQGRARSFHTHIFISHFLSLIILTIHSILGKNEGFPAESESLILIFMHVSILLKQ
ncbi:MULTISPECIES: hypothetical protein [unclassified Bacillus (in: firmicutes)]|uniref:hypothetical protein n=1 Tax=unclassified Bacillus (in: firmicutes) TaxID=185979 RepID=UPI000479CDFC|nr:MULTISPECIES: hypothetical protein [unclassified Bacillus (in: firmicutes)]WFA07253.1 hypothetical protein P3X63_11040 [Bacillus sp. HSf4]